MELFVKKSLGYHIIFASTTESAKFCVILKDKVNLNVKSLGQAFVEWSGKSALL